MDTDTATPPSDRLEKMDRAELLIAARIYKALAERRLDVIIDLEERMRRGK